MMTMMYDDDRLLGRLLIVLLNSSDQRSLITLPVTYNNMSFRRYSFRDDEKQKKKKRKKGTAIVPAF